MNLYVIRHGKTVWNENGIIQGRMKNRLSQQGKKETQELAEKLKDLAIDVIFTSPLMRTMQTANIINKFHNVKVVRDEDLIEIEQGIFSGRKKNSLSDEEKLLRRERSKLANMETYEECFERIKKFLTRLRKTDFENVLVVTHNCPASFIEDIISGEQVDFTDENFLRRFKNLEMKKFKIE